MVARGEYLISPEVFESSGSVTTPTEDRRFRVSVLEASSPESLSCRKSAPEKGLVPVSGYRDAV